MSGPEDWRTLDDFAAEVHRAVDRYETARIDQQVETVDLGMLLRLDVEPGTPDD